MVLNIEWSEEARADVRRLDKPAAQRVFDTLLRFARAGEGDIRQPGSADQLFRSAAFRGRWQHRMRPGEEPQT